MYTSQGKSLQGGLQQITCIKPQRSDDETVASLFAIKHFRDFAPVLRVGIAMQPAILRAVVSDLCQGVNLFPDE